jgi:D-alanine-D-alanine ligase-like ATP-grasp enzyme
LAAVAPPERIRLVVLFGGRSAEHEVSCVSALHVLQAADPARYEVVPVGIARDGRWLAAGDAVLALGQGARALPSPDESAGPELDPLPAVAPWIEVRRHELGEGFQARVAGELGFPVFVKPANLGSSVGITRVPGPEGLEAALGEALRYDEYVVVEEAVGGREIEVAVIGDESPRASVPGEIAPSREFYDYEDKYVDGAASLVVPADIGAARTTEVQELAVRAYRTLRVDGMARVDFFLEEGGRGFLVNELNTIPGFTPVSMFPRLWEASGVPYAELVDELVQLAVERHRRRSRFQTSR